jgi:hypothetical protein
LRERLHRNGSPAARLLEQDDNARNVCAMFAGDGHGVLHRGQQPFGNCRVMPLLAQPRYDLYLLARTTAHQRHMPVRQVQLVEFRL